MFSRAAQRRALHSSIASLGVSVLTYVECVSAGKPGIGATHSSRFIPLK